MIGHPVAFLAKLYETTQETQYLVTAKKYLDFALICDESIFSFHFAHKIARGAAIVAALTGEDRYKNLAQRIGQNLLDSQGQEGMWLPQGSHMDQVDQTAEVAVWFSEMAMLEGRPLSSLGQDQASYWLKSRI